MADGSISGFTQDKYAAVRAGFENNLATGADVGASFCATVNGETVVDLWGGWADEEKTRPWERDTIVNVYSTTKTMTALTALLLADRGELNFDAPVAKYWPEFAANGKSQVKVSHLMAHSAGMSAWREPVTLEDIYDWDKVCGLLAAQAPLWEPGSASGYHALTQGYLVGEVVRRVAGASVGTVFRTEIAEPLGADFHIGLPASEDHRVAHLIPPPSVGVAGAGAQNEIQKLTFTNPPIDVSATRSRAWRGAEIPAAGGTGNARSIAEIHTILANGGVAKGKRIMSEAGARKALELQIDGTDLIFGAPARFGLGFGLPGAMIPLPNPNSMFWGGYGGSLIIIDYDARTTFGFAMNKMGGGTVGDMRAFSMISAMWQALGVLKMIAGLSEPAVLGIAAAGGYLLGSIPFGMIATRLGGAGDIRKVGSGNIGATNVLRTGRRDLAAITLIGDGGKGAVAVLLATWQLGPLAAVIAGGAAFLGHLFPVWLRFRGGKGVATFFGILLAISWPVGLAAGATWIAMAALFRISSLAALTAAALAPLFVFAIDPGGEGKIWRVYLAVFMAVLIYMRHHENIRRLLAGTEPRIGGAKAAAPPPEAPAAP